MGAWTRLTDRIRRLAVGWMEFPADVFTSQTLNFKTKLISIHVLYHALQIIASFNAFT